MPPIISFLDFTTSAPPVATPLQSMTWTMTSTTAATVVSTGLNIVDPTRVSQLSITGGPRLWNGDEANNSGATNKTFPNGTVGKAWWETYQTRIRQDDRDWLVMDSVVPGTIYTSGPLTKYNNFAYAQRHIWGPWWLTLAVGQDIDIEVYTQGGLPDNWYTYQLGAGVAPGYGNFPLTPVLDVEFPLDANTYGPGCQFSGYTNSAISLFSTAANKNKMPEYFGVYISAAEAAAGSFGHADTEGWYVFGPKVDASPGVNGYCNYAPHAWPTGGSDGANGGLWNNASTYDVGVVYLSNYTGATGNGGTDSWSAPIGSLI